jgi:hypothetical protein
MPLSKAPTTRGAIFLLSCVVQEGEVIVSLGGTSKVFTAEQVVDGGSEALSSSGLPLSETPTPRGAIFFPAANEPRI